ncbi:MAG: flavin reductase [Lautropia sp.]
MAPPQAGLGRGGRSDAAGHEHPALAEREHPIAYALSPSDPAHLRQCLGRFATGVTIIATRDADGRRIGLTANSFNALSLDPPLILWSLSARAASVAAFRAQRHFAISVLSVGQIALARRFASRVADRFAGVAVHDGVDGVPLIDGALAWFECERRSESLQGDHWLFIGEVRRCAAADGSPLVFRHGEFAAVGALLPAPAPAAEPAGLEPGAGPFYEEYLPYLLARAGHQLAGRFQRQLDRHGLSLLAWRVLAALSSRDDWTIAELARVSLAQPAAVSRQLAALLRRQLVSRRVDPADARRVRIRLTARGRAKLGPVLQDAAAFNLSVLAEYPPEVLTGMKHWLQRMIANHAD